jgi:hypothetical protein
MSVSILPRKYSCSDVGIIDLEKLGSTKLDGPYWHNCIMYVICLRKGCTGSAQAKSNVSKFGIFCFKVSILKKS